MTHRAALPAWGRRAAGSDLPTPAGVVIISGPLPPPMHGAAHVTAAMSNALRRAGLTVLTVDTDGDGLTGQRYHARRVAQHARAALLVLVHAFRRRAPTLYIGGAGGLGLVYQTGLVATARLCRTPIIFHHHSYAYLRRRSLMMVALSRTAGPGALHLVLTLGMKERFDALYPGHPSRVLSNSAFVEVPSACSLPTAAEQDRPGPVFGQLSNLSREKGLETLLRSFAAYRAQTGTGWLRLAGPTASTADSELIRRYQARLGSGVIAAMGRIPHDAVQSFFGGIDIMIFPSTYANEAAPLVVLEAASMGVPTVAYDVGAVGELTTELLGVAVPASAASLEHALFANTERLQTLRRHGLVTQRFSAQRDQAVAELSALIETLR